MRFVHPYLLFLEILVPILILFYFFVFRKKRKDLNLFAQSTLLEKISNASGLKQKIKAALLIIAVFFIIISLAGPQFGTKLVEVKQKGIDIVIAVDVSSSMLAKDIKPDRLEKAKMVLSQLVQQLGGNRIGIVAFAGTAFWQCPLTLDISGANMFLQIMDANLIPLPGTVIGEAIRISIKGLEKTAPKSKAIILLTDGEDHKSDPLGAAQQAAKEGIKIFTVGFGSPTGEPIPLNDDQGNFTGYKKNKKGEVIMSKMDENLLLQVASQTGGEYFRASDGNVDLSRLLDDINNLDKTKKSSNINKQYEERYQYLLIIGILLLLIEYFIPETRKKS